MFNTPVSVVAESPRPAPVVFYGTSITQGGVVSRPGMAFTNIIGRSLSRDVLNFGYSGQGYMELSVARPARKSPFFFFRASVCAAPTLNAAGQSRVTLSLRQERLRAALILGPKFCPYR